MTVQISTLAIRPDLDPSRFADGAQRMASAQRQIVDGAREVSVAMADASGKLSNAGDPIAKLSRQFVAGYSDMSRFTGGMRSLNTMLETGKGAEQAAHIYQGMVQKLGLVADAADLTRQGYAQLGAMVERVNAQMAKTPSVDAIGGRLGMNDNMSTFRRQNLMYQAFDIGQTVGPLGIGRTLIQQGPQIAQLYAGQGGVNALLGDAGVLAGALVKRLGPVGVVATAGAVAIREMQQDIEKATGRSVTFGETFSSAIRIVAGDIKSVLAPALDELSPTMLAAWDKVSAGALLVGDAIINSFHAAYVDVKFLWSQFPNMMGSLVTNGLNAMVGGIQTMLQTGADYIDRFINKINAALAKAEALMPGRGYQLGTIGDLGFGPSPLPNLYEDDLRLASQDRNRRIAEVMSRRPLEDYYGSVRDRSIEDLRYSLPNGRSGSAIPVPRFRGIDDHPGGDDFMSDFGRQSAQRIEQMKQEIATVAMSGKALSAYRFEMDALNAAVSKNIDLSPQQKDEIRAQAAAYGALADALARSKLAVALQFDRDQMARSDLEATVAGRLQSAGLPVDLKSAEAGYIRQNELLRQQVELWHSIRETGKDAIDSIVDSAANGFQDLDDVLKGIASDMTKELLTLAVKNPLKNVLYNETAPTLDSVGGLGGFFGTMFGMTPNPAAGAPEIPGLSKSLSSMNVTATVVNLSGAGVGGADVSRLLAGANDNGAPAVQALDRMTGGSPLQYLGRFNQNVDGKLKDILEQAALRFPGYDIKASSGFRSGDPRFHGKGLAMDLQLWKDGKFLDNYQNASTFRDYEQFAQVARQVQMERYPELAGQFRWGGYFSGGKGKYGANDPMHFDLGGNQVGMAGGSWAEGLTAKQRALWPGIESIGMNAGKAAASIEKMAASSSGAAQGLLQFGEGAGNLGNALSKAGVGGGGGLGGLLSNLFGGSAGGLGGLAGAFNVVASGGFSGFYADGTEFAPPGWAWVGERGPELRKLRAGDVIRSNPASMQMAAQASRPAVTVNRQVVINNAPAGYHADVDEQDDGEGNEKINVTFSRMAAAEANRRGSSLNKTLASMGVRKPRIRR